MKVVLATRNQGKIGELRALLAPLDIEVLGLDSFPRVGEVEETGADFLANALLKARQVSQATGLMALADDSGLEVDALNGAPGVYSARFAGEKASDEENNLKLLAALLGVSEKDRTCRFVSVVAVHAPSGAELSARGAWEGRVGFKPVGENGFGYDPLFIDLDTGLSAAQMSKEEKNAHSHRGRALRELMRTFGAWAAKAG